MKKFLIALTAALVLCVPAFADNEVYFASLPFSLTNGSQSTTVTASNISGISYAYLQDTGGGIVSINVLSEDPDAVTSFYKSDIDTYINSSAYVAFGDYYRYIYDVTYFSPGYTTSIPITPFPSNVGSSYISSAFANFIANLPTPTPEGMTTFTLPRGNVLYFQVSSAQDVKFTSYMDTLSNIINFNTATYGAWGDTGQRYGEAASLPTAGTVFPLLSQSPIAWQKDSSTNILGQTKVGLATKHCIVGQWYCFYNPNANHVEGADPYNASPGASVVVQGDFSQIKVYPVNQKLSVVDGDLYSGSNDDFDSYYDGTIDQDGTVTWTNQDGNIEAPAAGGQNFEDGPKSATSLLEGIRVTLETVVHELQTLFTFGYSAIQSLVGIMSDFVSVFSGLYTWLPAEVYSALMSAVVVAIVIGVFKVFL